MCWERFLRRWSRFGRRALLLGRELSEKASVSALLPLAMRAGGPTIPERLAQTVLEIGDWLP